MGHFVGPATISDGVQESLVEVEIHSSPDKNATDEAWHVNIKGLLPKDLRLPCGKTLSVRLADGRQGVGTLVDPGLIRGAGEPPVG